ncbi:hypothetical protein LINGRAHAP2_LOCUS7086 [Linum grandiflorum]
MGPHAFRLLVHMLRERNLLNDNRYSSVEEHVAAFLYILGHNVRHRVVNFFFRWSGETISRHFHGVLEAILSLEDCVSAIDGTHVRAKVSLEDAPRYRGRKGIPTMNILAACTFDLKFTYILAGWEGSAADSRILENALTRDDKLKVPPGS